LIKGLLLNILLFVTLVLQGQEPVSIHLTEKDGLPDIEFYDILEDSKGFVWLAADKGLYRYNGSTYKNYTNKDKRALSVFELQEDDKGRLWCTNISGQFFYVENDKLITFIDLEAELNAQLSNFIVTKDYLLVFGFKSSYKVNLETKEISLLDNEASCIGRPMFYNGKLVYITNNGILCRDQNFSVVHEIPFLFSKQEKIITSGLKNKPTMFFNNKTSFIFSYFNGKNKFHKFNFETNTIKPVKTPEKLNTKVILGVFNNNEDLWFLTRFGIYVFAYENDEFIYKKTLFKNEFITKVIVDKNKNYWLTTIGNGVFLIPNINVLEWEIDKLNAITCIAKINNDSILFGTVKGEVGVYNLKEGTYSISTISKDEAVSAIVYNVNTNKAYVGLDLGICIISLDDFSFEQELIYGAIKSFSEVDNNTNLYASYSNAGFLEQRTINKFPEKLRFKRAYTTHYSKRYKTAFVGYSDQLIAYDSDFKESAVLNDGSSIFALSITETENGMIWVSTFNNGIFGIKNNAVVVNYTTKNGLLSNETGQIKADGNNLWITTDRGIQQLNVETQEFKTLTKEDGIPSYKINGIEILKNTIVFSSNKGIFSVDKLKAFKKTAIPEVYFTKVEIDKNDTTIKAAYNLPYYKNDIKIGFNANGYKSRKHNTYQYRLVSEGAEKTDWEVANASENTVPYYSLKPGDYTFEVKPFLANNDETLSTNSIKITINKPFWETWWFYGLLLIGIGVLLYWYFTKKIKNLEANQKLQLEKEIVNKQLVLSQLENLRSQMNPHFIFNALNSIQEYIVLNEKELASTFLVKFSRLIRIYLEHSRKDNITLREEIKALNLYLELEKNRFEEALDYKIEVDKNSAISQIKIPSLFIQPYVENALKHGLLHKKTNRKLLIAFKLNTEYNLLTCVIEDNGVGIEASKEINKNRAFHTPFATSANLKRVALLNINRTQKIHVTVFDLSNSTSKSGTRITITIPIPIQGIE